MNDSLPRRIFLTCNTFFLLVVALVCVAPFVNLLSISFSDRIAVAAGEVTFWPRGFTLVAYEFITGSSSFIRSLIVSFRRVAIGVPVNLVLIVLTAYPLSKSKDGFRARSIFSWYFVVTILFSGGLIPTYMVVRYTGLIDSIWSLVFPTALPVFSMLVVMNYMRTLPKELEEAAYIDGANHVQTLLRVILPVSTPTIATVALFSFVTHWNTWFDGMIYMNRMEKYPLSSYLHTVVVNPAEFLRLHSDMSGNLQKYLALLSIRTTSAAQLFLAMIPILVIYPYLQKYFATGLVMGSVKG
jgi:putative aldouronate transport system permease protein